MNCNASYEKKIIPERYANGVISIIFFKENIGISHVVGKVIDSGKVYSINREIGFNYEIIDISKGMFKVKNSYLKTLPQDNLPKNLDSEFNLDNSVEKSDYLIIKMINKNTYMLSSPVAPILLCVSA